MLINRSFIAKAMLVLAATGAICAISYALVQRPPPKAPAAPPEAAPKTTPNSQQKDAPAAAGQQQPAEGPQITFSPWTKVCRKSPEANSQKVCFTGKDGRIDSGMPFVAAVLIEADGQPNKLLRITVPLGMALQPGTRVIVDDGQPMTAPYVACDPNGCTADYEATEELIDDLKKAKGMGLQGIRGNRRPFGVILPLAGFAKAHDGPPMDEKEFEEQQKKLQQPHAN
jgi:invasion protein IalB